jgi:hypothetical protein
LLQFIIMLILNKSVFKIKKNMDTELNHILSYI